MHCDMYRIGLWISWNIMAPLGTGLSHSYLICLKNNQHIVLMLQFWKCKIKKRQNANLYKNTNQYNIAKFLK